MARPAGPCLAPNLARRSGSIMSKPVRVQPSVGRPEADAESFCYWDGDTLVLNVLGQPNASRDAIGKVTGHQLNISVTQAPVRGRATDHMLRFLAPHFGVAVGDIDVVFGRYHVNKQLRIRSPQKLPTIIGKHLQKRPPDPGA
jgi:uncharacterized protein